MRVLIFLVLESDLDVLILCGSFVLVCTDFCSVNFFTPTCLAGKLLSTLLCCKLLCCQTISMGGILMCARSNFMGLDRASPLYFLFINYGSLTSPYRLFKFSLQEPYSASTISLYFTGVHHLLLREMRKVTEQKLC